MKTSNTVAFISDDVLLYQSTGEQDDHAPYLMEIVDCPANASWEADLILIDQPDAKLEQLCKKIKPYVTLKKVVVFTESDLLSQIKTWLPDSDVRITSKKNIQNYKLNTNHDEKNDI